MLGIGLKRDKSEKMKKMNVVYCCDDGFVDIFCTSISSLIINNYDNDISIFLINNNISEAKIRRIRQYVSGYSNVDISILPFPDLELIFSNGITFDKKHLSISTYGRLFVGQIIPKSIDKILYLDCDTIICTDISELFCLDLEDKIVGGVDDCKSFRYRRVLGLKKNDFYINAGVLLINLKKWREMDCEKRLIKYINYHKGIVQFEDQGAINATLNNEIMMIPMKYNAMTHIYDLSYEELLFFRRPVFTQYLDNILEVKNHPSIIHYTSSFLTFGRVWNTNTNHKKKEIFNYYMKIANVYEERKPYAVKGLKKTLFFAKKALPKKIFIFVAMIFHEYLSPLKYYVLMKRRHL